LVLVVLAVFSQQAVLMVRILEYMAHHHFPLFGLLVEVELILWLMVILVGQAAVAPAAVLMLVVLAHPEKVTLVEVEVLLAALVVVEVLAQ
jgi:hypothetical protein